MRDASRSEALRRRRGGSRSLRLRELWRLLGPEQRVAGVASVLLIVSTLGPFSFVEAGLVLTGAGVLLLLKSRAEGREFHLPFGDGTVVVLAGCWAALLIVVRLFDRPLGQGLLALACAALLAAAGLRERRRRPADDLPATRRRAARQDELPTDMLAPGEEPTRRLEERPREPAPAGQRPAQRALPGLERPAPLEIPEPEDPPSPEDLPARRPPPPPPPEPETEHGP
jgi:hypothetical protein